MDVEQREAVDERVVGGPGPGVGEPVEIGGDRRPRDDRALRQAGGARGVHDQRRRGVADRAPTPRLAHRSESGTRGRSDSGQSGDPAITDAPGVAEDVLALHRAGVGGNGHDGHAGAQAGDDRDHGVERRRARHGDHRGARDVAGERVGAAGELLPRDRLAVDRHGIRAITERAVEGGQQAHPRDRIESDAV